MCVSAPGWAGMTTQIGRTHKNQLAAELRLLATSPTAAIKQRWRALYGTNPPPRIGRGLLLRAVAYRLQERARGGLKPSTRRLLERLADEAGAGHPLHLTTPSPLAAGTVLMRDWQGVTHEVTVLERGVLYRQQRYRSLSEVARLITGCRWSGPLFFGLRKKASGDPQNGQQ
jgi:hypothetical protein